ncbi:MAG TPA: DUF2326 domain-containing protein [Haloplasmataceae bacterium]
MFDLAALFLTPLPAIAHDSFILKQIGDTPFENILKIYSSNEKQIFISIDKEESYSKKAQEIMKNTEVLYLSEDGNELFGWAWNEKQQKSRSNDRSAFFYLHYFFHESVNNIKSILFF